ncbi:MAG: hypothetical protein ACO1SX_10835 [Actinomycetota bacterium]
MNQWEEMFRWVQGLLRSGCSVEEALRRALQFAQSRPDLFPETSFWTQVERHLTKLPVDRVVDWAREGLENLGPGQGWKLALLDLGDCPESFFLYSPGGQELLEEEKIRRSLFADAVIDCCFLEECFDQPVDDPFEQLFGDDARKERTYHNVRELKDEILTWNVGGSVDFQGNSGYLLWLTIGSLALLQLLRDDDYRRRILRGRERLYVLCGYEEIFFYAATATRQGLLFEDDAGAA